MNGFILELLCCVFGLTLASAGLSKIRDRQTFFEVAREYRLPGLLNTPAAIRAVPFIELGLGALILTAYGAAQRFGLGGSLVFIAGASVAIVRRLTRGETEFRCGCGSDLGAPASAVSLLLRNAFLILLIVALLAFDFEPSPRVFVYVTGTALVLCARLLAAVHTARRSVEEWKASG